MDNFDIPEIFRIVFANEFTHHYCYTHLHIISSTYSKCFGPGGIFLLGGGGGGGGEVTPHCPDRFDCTS